MRSSLSILFLGSFGVLVACGGESKPAVTPETTSTPAPTASVDAPATTTPTTPAPEANKPAEPVKATPKVDVTGKWCAKQVPDAASCKGKDAMYVEITSAGGDAVVGQICEGYNHDCMPLESSSFTGNNLTLGATMKGSGAKKDTLKGNLTLGTEDVLTGEFVSTKAKAPIKKTLYRIK